MSKYRVKFEGIAICVKEIDIRDEGDPYTEADNFVLQQNDFDIDMASVSIVDLKPIATAEGAK